MNCINFKNPEVAALLLEYTEILGSENAAYYVIAENNGYGLDKAPNGADSELFKTLLDGLNGDRAKAIKEKAKVYTKSFRDWFGDWIADDKTNVSKVVDLNGEPLVVYHGSRDKFNIFDSASRTGKYHDSGQFGVGDYFTINKQTAASYGDNKNIYPVFLNIKSPFNGSIENVSSSLGIIKSSTEFKETFKDAIKDQNLSEEDINKMLGNYDTTDGVIINSTTINFDELVTFNPNQIKSALYNEGTFSTKDDNIYHSLGDIDENIVTITSKYASRYTNELWLTEDSEENVKLVTEVAKKAGYRLWKVDKLTSGGLQAFALQYVGKGFLNITSEKDKEFIGVYLDYLKKTFPEIEYKWISQNEFFEKFVTSGTVNPDARSFVDGRTVYLIGGRVTSETAIEEFLHPLVTSMQHDNTNTFNMLLEDSLLNYKTLSDRVAKRYSTYHLSIINNEIVTHALTEILKKKYDSLSKKDRSFLTKFFMWMVVKLKRAARNIIRRITRNKKVTLKDIARDIVESLVKVDLSKFKKGDIMFSLNEYGRPDAEVDLLNLFLKMYRKYEKLLTKTVSQQRIQDTIWEKYQLLRDVHNEKNIERALDFALDKLGVIDSHGILSKEDTILGYFRKRRVARNKFENVTAEDLFNMWDNILVYLLELHDIITRLLIQDDTEWATPEIREKAGILLQSYENAVSNWRFALILVTDEIIDTQVDKYYILDDEKTRKNVKEKTKDWLHRNAMHSDITWFSKWFENYAYNANPNIRIAFLMIQEAEAQVSLAINEKSAEILGIRNKVAGITDSVLPFSWERVFMEYDRYGMPTGNFVRPINYGQFNQDRTEFIKRLSKHFDDKYGFHYCQNDAGITISTKDNHIAEEEQWEYNENGEPIRPPYIEWLLAIEKWECEHANKRYLYKYYEERLSVPFSAEKNENCAYNVNAIQGHGLSLKTLAKYNRILSNINYYLDKCTNIKTGLVYPEKLSPEDLRKLDYWKEELNELSNPYTRAGELKDEERVQQALEILAWLNFIGKQTAKQYDTKFFEQEKQRIEQEATYEFVLNLGHIPLTPDETKNLRICVLAKRSNFLKYNARWLVHPEYLRNIFGLMNSVEITDPDYKQAIYFKSALNRLIHQEDDFKTDLAQFLNNPSFFARARENDLRIADIRYLGGSSMDKHMLDIFQSKFNNTLALHVIKKISRSGIPVYFYIDRRTRAEVPISKATETLVKLGDFLTEYQHVKEQYMLLILEKGYIEGLVDANGDHIRFDGKNEAYISRWLEDNLFMYTYKYKDKRGLELTNKKVLSVFMKLEPTHKMFVDSNGNNVPTTGWIPTGNRFTKPADKNTDNNGNPIDTYYNSEYDYDDINGVQPKKELYENKAFYKMSPALKALYDKLIETMQEAMDIIQPNAGQYQYFLPLIEADLSAVLSRWGKTNVKDYIKESMFDIQQNDLDYVRVKHSMKNADGTDMLLIPIRFLDKLKDPSTISSNVTGNVLQFINMAYLFREKTKIMPKLNLLQQALSPEVRKYTGDRLYTNTGKDSWEAFRNMMDVSMFERKNRVNEDNVSANKHVWNSTFANKVSTKVRHYLHLAMLGFNYISAFSGGFDFFYQLTVGAVIGKYGTPRDVIMGGYEVIKSAISMIKSIGTPLPTCKLTALMQMNNLSNFARERYHDVVHSRLSFWGSLSNILMCAFTFLDYIGKGIMLVQNYSNVRFYDGDLLPTGFYTRHEFITKCKRKGISSIDSRVRFMTLPHSLYDAYGFKNGRLFIKPQYKNYIDKELAGFIYSKSHSRAAVHAGTQPSNDTPLVSTTTLGKTILGMRNFMTQNLQLWLSHGDDYTVYDTKDITEDEIKGRDIKQVKRRIATKKDENRLSDRSFNIATREMNDLIWYEMWSLIKWIYINLKACFSKKAQFMKMDYVLRNALVTLTVMFGSLNITSDWNTGYINDLRESMGGKPAPSGYITEDGSRSSNVLDFSPTKWIEGGDYKVFIADVGLRLTLARADQILPTLMYEAIKSLSAFSGGIDTFSKGIYGFTTKRDFDTLNKSGAFRGETNLAKYTAQSIGPLKSLHTAFTPNGAWANINYYLQLSDFIRKLMGNEIKKVEDIKKELKKDNRTELEKRLDERKQRFENSSAGKRLKERNKKIEQRLKHR